ncbi:hypothetical protein M2480_002945 [Parabacteroides sp. PFB2-12]|uniref:outer membrane beta-barrel protein n=1 Tax=unclassified Parabacteroides TaxID=2649774 RepID=UPI00247404B7|nr:MULTISPECIES: outer membrane beta-barrel protein [unclassified Parabacteroides]MDH6343780.1 hypothetical protein [Parabacteroides sp. PM6-13]MDH6391942.1 hypothetical protein [Parabacteroides sp. PFB2-12]
MDHTNDIVQVYRQRQDEFRLPLRNDSWQQLEKELFPTPKRRLSFAWYAAAAIALLCLVLSVFYLLPEKEQPVLVNEPQQEERIEPAKEVITPSPIITPLLGEEKKIDSTTIEEENTIKQIEEVESEESEEETNNSEPEEDNIDKPKKEASPVGPANRYNKRQPDPYRQYRTIEQPRQPRWAIGVTGGSGLKEELGGVAESYVTDPGPGYGQDGEDEPGTKAAAGGGNQDSPGDAYYQHKLPVSVGLSVRRYLTKRISVETGLSYTILYADIVKGRESEMTVGHQYVHYLGIPLKANWTFYERGPFSSYLSGGGMVEYATYLKKETDGRIASWDINRWQFSLQAAIGLQLSVYKPFSIYAEPGVFYYFDTGNRFVETFRTLNPLTFNLQVGVRFSY